MVRKMNAARAEHQAETEVSTDPQVQQQFRWVDPTEVVAVESPARRLQTRLQDRLATPQRERWSARRSVVFIFATNAVLWTAVIAGVGSLF